MPSRAELFHAIDRGLELTERDLLGRTRHRSSTGFLECWDDDAPVLPSDAPSAQGTRSLPAPPAEGEWM